MEMYISHFFDKFSLKKFVDKQKPIIFAVPFGNERKTTEMVR